MCNKRVVRILLHRRTKAHKARASHHKKCISKTRWLFTRRMEKHKTKKKTKEKVLKCSYRPNANITRRAALFDAVSLARLTSINSFESSSSSLTSFSWKRDKVAPRWYRERKMRCFYVEKEIFFLLFSEKQTTQSELNCFFLFFSCLMDVGRRGHLFERCKTSRYFNSHMT